MPTKCYRIMVVRGAGGKETGVRSAWRILLGVLVFVGLWLVGSGGALEANAGRLWAVLVGIDVYDRQEVPPLRCAVADATLLRDTLKALKVPDERLFLLTSDRGGDSKATKGNIVFRLTQLRNQVKPGDTVVFFFAGHGMELEEGASYLLPTEADARNSETLEDTALPGTRVASLLKMLPASRLLVLIDACRNDPRGGRAAADNVLGRRIARDLQLDEGAAAGSSSNRTSATLFACRPGERAFEWPDQGHGFFSWYLAEGLKGKAADGSGLVTLPRLVSYVENQVRGSSQAVTGRTQTPWLQSQGSGLDGWALVQAQPGSAGGPIHPAPALRPSPAAQLASEPTQPHVAVVPSAPVVSISAPLAGQRVDGDKVFLAALVSGGGPLQEVSVSVDGRPVVVDSGAVRHTSGGAVLNVPLPLAEGQHTIVVLALGQTGAPGQAAVTVVRDRTEAPAPPPRPSPAAQLAAVPAYPQVPASGALPREMTNPKDGSVLVLVPAGSFRMGSEDGESREKPVHVVTLRDYYIGRCEVTNAQFKQFIKKTNHDAGPEWKKYAGQWGAQAPVVCVSWDDAQAYCRWAGGRLPTEAEWEKAARGTDGRRYPWGDTWDSSRAWCVESSRGQAHPVGLLPAGVSPYGCLDMAGNVWEWCGDWYGAYPSGSVVDPTGPSSGSYRVIRGGSWFSGAQSAWAALRNNGAAPFYRINNLGFRLARSLP